MRASKHRKRLQELIRIYADCESTDPRDAIYGLVGLASDGHELAVDYAASTETIYTEVMELDTEHDSNFSILLQKRLGLRQGFYPLSSGRRTSVENETFKIRPLSFISADHNWIGVPRAFLVNQAALKYTQLHPQLEIQMTDNYASHFHNLWPNFTGDDIVQIRVWGGHMENCQVCVDPLGVHLRGRTFCGDGLRLARNVMAIIFQHAMKTMKPDQERNLLRLYFKIWTISGYPELYSLLQAADVLSRQPGDADTGSTFNHDTKGRAPFYLKKPWWYVENQILHRHKNWFIEPKNKKRAQIFQPPKT